MSAAPSTPTDPGPAERLLVAAIVAFASQVIAYAAIRVVQIAFFPQPNPALVVWSSRVDYFWRLGTAAFLAGALGLQAFALLRTRRRWALAVRWLPKLMWSAFAILLVQGTLFP